MNSDMWKITRLKLSSMLVLLLWDRPTFLNGGTEGQKTQTKAYISAKTHVSSFLTA